jgi:hypothetical protein
MGAPTDAFALSCMSFVSVRTCADVSLIGSSSDSNGGVSGYVCMSASTKPAMELTFVNLPLSLTLTRASSVARSCTSHQPCSTSVPHAVRVGAMSFQSSCLSDTSNQLARLAAYRTSASNVPLRTRCAIPKDQFKVRHVPRKLRGVLRAPHPGRPC